MNVLIKIIISTYIFCALIGCSKMDDKHNEYFSSGERIYLTKIDSVMVLPGHEKVQLKIWNFDPRIRKVGIYWSPNNDSIIYRIDEYNPGSSFDIDIGDNFGMKSIAEGRYTFLIVGFDDMNNSSIPVEYNIYVYGDSYESRLVNRPIRNVNYSSIDNILEIEFSELALNETECQVEINYFSKNENKEKIIIPTDILNKSSTVTISDIDPYKEIVYTTRYIPVPSAIDTFSTNFSDIEIVEIKNVALNKPVAWSDEHSSGLYPGPKAVDGVNFTNETRWVSGVTGEHWIEIDLENEYSLFSIETWNGSNGNLTNPIPIFNFQVEKDGQWLNIVEETSNSAAHYITVFPDVNTSKVRYFVPEYSDNMVRLYEIAVYAIIRY